MQVQMKLNHVLLWLAGSAFGILGALALTSMVLYARAGGSVLDAIPWSKQLAAAAAVVAMLAWSTWALRRAGDELGGRMNAMLAEARADERRRCSTANFSGVREALDRLSRLTTEEIQSVPELRRFVSSIPTPTINRAPEEDEIARLERLYGGGARAEDRVAYHRLPRLAGEMHAPHAVLSLAGDGREWAIRDGSVLERGDVFELESIARYRHQALTIAQGGRFQRSMGLSPSEALYAFLGWLTARETALTLGAAHDSALPCSLLVDFMAEQGLEPARDGWDRDVIPMPRYECTVRFEAEETFGATPPGPLQLLRDPVSIDVDEIRLPSITEDGDTAMAHEATLEDLLAERRGPLALEPKEDDGEELEPVDSKLLEGSGRDS